MSFLNPKIGIFANPIYPWMIDLATEMSARGFSTYIFSLGTFGNYPWKSLEAGSYSIARILGRPIPSPSLFVDILRVRCDAVVLLSAETLLGLVTFFLSKFSCKKRIVIVEENSPLDALIWRIKRVIVRRMYYDASSLLAESEKSKFYLRVNLGVNNKPIQVVPHGVVVKRYNNATPQKHEKIIFLFVGEISHYKGADYLFDAIEQISRDQPILEKIVVKLRPRGPLLSSKKIRDRLKTLIDLGIVSPYDNIPLEEMPQLYGSADVVIVPSSEFEGGSSDRSPNSLLEALAAQKAIIATAVGGIPTIAQDAVYYVDPKNPSSLAEAMKRFASDENIRNYYSKLSRQRAQELDMSLYAQTITNSIRGSTVENLPSC
jgi:glycosyltransferase involved in cell wall biosynthesis